MLKLGEVFYKFTPNGKCDGKEYFIVTETGSNPRIELLDDFIMRNYVVRDQSGGCYTIAEIVNREKYKAITGGNWNVPSN